VMTITNLNLMASETNQRRNLKLSSHLPSNDIFSRDVKASSGVLLVFF
jgi:hypothetical protein